jgi:hypothetical protein
MQKRVYKWCSSQCAGYQLVPKISPSASMNISINNHERKMDNRENKNMHDKKSTTFHTRSSTVWQFEVYMHNFNFIWKFDSQLGTPIMLLHLSTCASTCYSGHLVDMPLKIPIFKGTSTKVWLKMYIFRVFLQFSTKNVFSDTLM